MNTEKYKVTKRHPFIKKGIIIHLMPCVWVYYIHDGTKGMPIQHECIEHWIKERFIKDYKNE
jgi:hypothetical protein